MTALSLTSTLAMTGAPRRPGDYSWLRGPLKLWSVISTLWTTALLSALPLVPSRALDLSPSADRDDTTIAQRERQVEYDTTGRHGVVPVDKRERAQFSPQGVRAGNFIVLPSIGTTVVFDDNVTLTNRNRQSDFRTEITPELRVISQLPRHSFDLSLGGKIVNHLEHGDLDRASAHIKAGAALHFDHAHTLSMSVMSRLDHTDQLDPLSPTYARQLIPFTQHRSSIGLTRDAGRLYGTLSATFESLEYENVTASDGSPIEASASDMRTFSGEMRLGYRFSPGFEAIGKLRALRQLNRGTETLDRDANGYEVLAGLQAEASPLLRWRVLGGYGLRDYDQASLETVASQLLEAEVQWLPTQLLTVHAGVRRAISETGDLTASALVETAFKTRLYYEVWHNVVLSFSGEIKEHDYSGTDRRDTIMSARFGVDWHLSPNWLVNVSFEHLVRDSNLEEFDLTRNLVMVGAKLRF